MPIINPDLTEALEMGPLDPGTYPAEIEAVEAQTSKKGNPMIVVDFKVKAGDREVPRKGYLVITGAGAYGFEQLLRATGFDEIADAFKQPGQKPAFNTDDLVGQKLNVVIEPNEYNGQIRDQIAGYLRA